MDKYPDYRTYPSFDMQQLIQNQGEAIKIRLNKVIKENSDEEGQNPLYATSLAGFIWAHRINLPSKVEHSPAIRSMVPDETFSKVSGEKVASCIELIRGLGFQAIISTTNGKIQNYVENADKTFIFANPNKKSIFVQEFERECFMELMQDREDRNGFADTQWRTSLWGRGEKPSMNVPLECIIRKYENNVADWKEDVNGSRPVMSGEQNFKEARKQSLMNQLMRLGKEGLPKVRWYQYGAEAEKVWYRLEQMETIYQRLGEIPKFKRVNALKGEMGRQLALIQDQQVRSYYQSFPQSLNKGDVPKVLDTPKRELLFTCLKAIDCLWEPVYKRIFSKKYLGSSKASENHLQSKILSAARVYLDTVNDNIDDYQVPDWLLINGYARELTTKRSLIIELEGGKINLSLSPCEFISNSRTPRKTSTPPEQSVTRVITAKDKANHGNMPCEGGTLIVCSHGYFSSDEHTFLIHLERIPSSTRTSCGTTYLHTGDLDYGRVRIF